MLLGRKEGRISIPRQPPPERSPEFTPTTYEGCPKRGRSSGQSRAALQIPELHGRPKHPRPRLLGSCRSMYISSAHRSSTVLHWRHGGVSIRTKESTGSQLTQNQDSHPSALPNARTEPCHLGSCHNAVQVRSRRVIGLQPPWHQAIAPTMQFVSNHHKESCLTL